MPRRSKNGQFKRTTRRRRSKPKLNLLDTATSLVVANAVTQGLTQTNLIDFFSGRQKGVYRAGTDGALRITLPEMITGFNPGSSGTYRNFTLGDAIKKNFKDNAFPMLTTVFVAPIVARTAKKVLRKPVLTPMNKFLKMSGLDVKV